MRSIGFTAILLMLASYNAFAADPNGYTSEYECRTSGPYCDVDVTNLASQSCDQIITTSTTPTNDWSAINWSNTVICIEAGDHTGRGKLIMGSSGTSSTYKVLRYYRSGDTDDDPWDQTVGNRAILRSMYMDGKDYWIIHRLTIDPDNASTKGIEFPINLSSTNIILDRILAQKTDNIIVDIRASQVDITLQNSVIRTATPRTTYPENQCISVKSSTDIRIVNNEIYDCNKGSHSPGPTNGTGGFILENNDIYQSTAYYTDCNGNYSTTGACGIMEAIISWKSGGKSSNPAKIIHNRLWGTRPQDGNVGLSSGGDTPAISLSNQDLDGQQNPDMGADYVLVQNNIISDSQLGLWNYWDGPNNNSLIGNILYDIRYDTIQGGNERGAISYWRVDNSEYYLNTVVDSDTWLRTKTAGQNNDIRCNVAIDSDDGRLYAGTGTEVDYNVFYGTTEATTESPDNNLGNYTLNTWTASTAYSLNDLVKIPCATPSTCTTSTGKIVKVTVAGTSGSTEPSWPSLGGTVTDDSVTWQVVRGPYTFYRKLRTGPEEHTIPYARVHTSVPETHSCPSNFSSRLGIGINDEQ